MKAITDEEALYWLFAVETLANDCGEIGDFDGQEFGCEWFADIRGQVFRPLTY